MYLSLFRLGWLQQVVGWSWLEVAWHSVASTPRSLSISSPSSSWWSSLRVWWCLSRQVHRWATLHSPPWISGSLARSRCHAWRDICHPYRNVQCYEGSYKETPKSRVSTCSHFVSSKHCWDWTYRVLSSNKLTVCCFDVSYRGNLDQKIVWTC